MIESYRKMADEVRSSVGRSTNDQERRYYEHQLRHIERFLIRADGVTDAEQLSLMSGILTQGILDNPYRNFDEQDVEEDDGTCGPCGGSGGGDYPGIYCPHCNGRGYRKVRGEP